ncbi:MAG: hypothetical protein R2877_04415 [Bdellovibrionota bacterium]
MITTVALIYYPNSNSHQVAGVVPDYILKDDRFDAAVSALKDKNDPMIIYERIIPMILPYDSGNLSLEMN